MLASSGVSSSQSVRPLKSTSESESDSSSDARLPMGELDRAGDGLRPVL